jgi:hypothetical protein
MRESLNGKTFATSFAARRVEICRRRFCLPRSAAHWARDSRVSGFELLILKDASNFYAA